MAKRRNLKKEKALRNLAYARKFRKRTTNGRYGSRRRFDDNRLDETENEAGKGGAEEGAAAE
jgi:hypothetical protein